MHSKGRWLLAFVLGVAVVSSLSAAQVTRGKNDAANPDDLDVSEEYDYDDEEDDEDDDEDEADISDFSSNFIKIFRFLARYRVRRNVLDMVKDAFAKVIPFAEELQKLPGVGEKELQCMKIEEVRARTAQLDYMDELEECFIEGSTYVVPPSPTPEDDDVKEDEEEDEEEAEKRRIAAEEQHAMLQREATEILSLALRITSVFGFTKELILTDDEDVRRLVEAAELTQLDYAAQQALQKEVARVANLTEEHRSTLEALALTLLNNEMDTLWDGGCASCVLQRVEEVRRSVADARTRLHSCMQPLLRASRDEL